MTPLRVDHALVRVSNLKRALDYYRILYGKEALKDGNHATFQFRNGSRLMLEGASYSYGSTRTRIVKFGIKVQPHDRAATAAGIAALGGTVVSDGGSVLRLHDADGIELELVTS